MQQPSKGGGKGARRGGGKRTADKSDGLFVSSARRSKKPRHRGLVYRLPRRKPQPPWRRPQEAHCSGQGFPGPANAVTDCASSSATAKARNASNPTSASPLDGANPGPLRTRWINKPKLHRKRRRRESSSGKN
eukprot:4081382-Amphidinium_carterae.1